MQDCLRRSAEPSSLRRGPPCVRPPPTLNSLAPRSLPQERISLSLGLYLQGGYAQGIRLSDQTTARLQSSLTDFSWITV